MSDLIGKMSEETDDCECLELYSGQHFEQIFGHSEEFGGHSGEFGRVILQNQNPRPVR